ncbi:hypothetical protein GCK32_005481 [Trichostrongylus colubriformis]|uniref:Uncharacterized protein n=1 Tax=Trichostrongylus colubriformis TaxID=6319 RepID=A0AAN8GBR7_TRICO
MSRSSGPVTRAQARLAQAKEESAPPEGLTEESLPAVPKFTEDIQSTLIDLADNDPVLGRDAKELRDATANAVTEVWHDAHHSTELLAQQISQHGDRRVIEGYVRLGKLTKSADAANEAVSRMLHNVECVEGDRRVIEGYVRLGKLTKSADAANEAVSRMLHNVECVEDQREALDLAMAGHPIAGINAAFGTGKTFLASVIAGLLIQAGKGPVIVTTTTNNGAAHFTNTLLAIEEFRSLRLLRYISEAAFLDESPTTPADIHEILKSLEDQYDLVLNAEKRLLCSRFGRGRTLYEQYARDPDRSMNMNESEIEEYILAEKEAAGLEMLARDKDVTGGNGNNAGGSRDTRGEAAWSPCLPQMEPSARTPRPTSRLE